ncbi:MAG: 50S ribosomal protein L24 [Syntrophomonadaceae bacterium]|nr:50S ribosomal protein L24 [Syntrophomonadaceae bacterium]
MSTPKVHVKKGDTVIVITGKSIGKKGKILEVEPEKQRVLVEGVNMVKRHTKPSKNMQRGGIIEKESPVASSNVMIFCGRCSKPTRIGKKLLDNGTKARVCKKCGEVLDK